MISVVIPLYNKASKIKSTLTSVLAQTYLNYEVVVVDDGSTDNSADIVRNFSDPRVRLIQQANAGVSAARNRGIIEAKGDFIAFLDADDRWASNFLLEISKLIDSYPECDVFSARYNFEDEYGRAHLSKMNYLCIEDGSSGIVKNYFKVASNSDAPLWTSAVVVRKRALISVDCFPVGVTSGEDLLTWAKLACRYRIAYCNMPLATYYTPTSGPTGKVPADLTSIRDKVGCSLVGLYHKYPASGIREYIGFWYKMRGVINLRRGNRWAAVKCAVKSVYYHSKNIKSWTIIALSICPNFIIKRI